MGKNKYFSNSFDINSKILPRVLNKKKNLVKNNCGPWSLLPEGLSTSTGPYFFESVLPGQYMGGPYKMIMRVNTSGL